MKYLGTSASRMKLFGERVVSLVHLINSVSFPKIMILYFILQNLLIHENLICQERTIKNLPSSNMKYEDNRGKWAVYKDSETVTAESILNFRARRAHRRHRIVVKNLSSIWTIKAEWSLKRCGMTSTDYRN